MSTEVQPLAGGFLLSPPASITSSPAPGILLITRRTPLKAGSKKESSFIRYFDTQIGNIRRRLAKRYETESVDGIIEPDGNGGVIRNFPIQARIPEGERWGHGTGYASFSQAVRDVRHIFDLVWTSAAPGIQIPYTITLASIVNEVIPAFPPQSKPLFVILKVLDHAFASLIQQRDIDTGRPLAGFDASARRRVTDTEKVRINSLVNRARVAVSKHLDSGDIDMLEDEDDDNDDDDVGFRPAATGTDEDNDQEMHSIDSIGELILELPDPDPVAQSRSSDGADLDDIDVKISRIYDKTLMELGSFTFGSDLGPRTE